MAKVTIRDVAQEAGVSISLVSLVLNAKTRPDGTLDCSVKAETARRVQEVIDRLGYRPNKAAASLRSGRGYTIGVCVPDISNRFFANLSRCLENQADNDRYVVQFASHDESLQRFEHILDTYMASGVEGLILAPCKGSEQAVERVVASGIPTVLIDRDLAGVDAGRVMLDNVEAGRMMVDHLFHNGYHNIEIVSNTLGLSSMEGRLKGYIEAMHKYGLQNNIKVHYVDYHNLNDDMVRTFDEALERGARALILPTSSISLAGLLAAKSLKVRVPEELALVGFEENNLFHLHEPTVTHVCQPIRKVAEEAFGLLMRLMAKDNVEKTIILKPTMVTGGSTISLSPECPGTEQKDISVIDASNSILLSGSMFSDKGGWTVDSQYMDQMGSTYLLAHGLGNPVRDAVTRFEVENGGEYNVFVRTRNWTSRWSDAPTPGIFRLMINRVDQGVDFGTGSGEWHWQNGGKRYLKKGVHEVTVHDLTGFEGRFDAILFTMADVAPDDSLETVFYLRNNLMGVDPLPQDKGEFDFVVAGGGVAGMCAAIAAARNGVKVALIQDRTVLGGNNSSEVRVGLGGRLNIGNYPSLGYLMNEFGPARKGNARPKEYYEDDKKLQAVLNEKNITLFLGYRITSVTKDSPRTIRSVVATNVMDYSKIEVRGRLFSDCTGDAGLGFLAGAQWHMGRDPKSRYGEPSAPVEEDGITLGASVQWYSEEGETPCSFPAIDWGLPVDERNVQVVRRGQWYWEVGMRDDQIEEAEMIRDYGMYVAYSNWAYLKNNEKYRDEYANSYLGWLSFIAGKRESRRLVGEFVLKEQDLKDFVIYPDGTACTSWYIDNHEPDPENSKLFPGREYISKGCLTPLGFYPIPYRCFYSKDLDNMFMAGRNISVSHIALGTVRVMRTTAMMGEVVGLAASVCHKGNLLPRDISTSAFDKLKTLMNKGAGNPNMPYLQVYTLIDTTAARSEDC